MSPSRRTATTPAPGVTGEARRAVRLAWLCLGLLPVSLVAAMVLGEWLLTVQGYESGAEDVAVAAAMKAGLPALLVLVAPGLVSIRFGLRARSLGHPDWSAPLLTAVVIVGASVVLNSVQVLVKLLGDL